jgi:predicted nucleic acid-binding protein
VTPRYLLDTTVLIDHAGGWFGATALIERLLGETGELYVCDAIVAEALSKGSDEEIATIERLIAALEYAQTTPDAARRAGTMNRQSGRQSRRRLGDALIAGVAWDFDATLVTRNPRDFESQGIRVLAYGQATP